MTGLLHPFWKIDDYNLKGPFFKIPKPFNRQFLIIPFFVYLAAKGLPYIDSFLNTKVSILLDTNTFDLVWGQVLSCMFMPLALLNLSCSSVNQFGYIKFFFNIKLVRFFLYEKTKKMFKIDLLMISPDERKIAFTPNEK